MKKLEKFGVAAIAAAIIPLIIVPAAADPVADFYRGRTITMMISSGVGGGYNAFSRTLSRHMGKHIPGNPKFINTNRVGAGGMVAANYAYNRSPKDGSVIAIIAALTDEIADFLAQGRFRETVGADGDRCFESSSERDVAQRKHPCSRTRDHH